MIKNMAFFEEKNMKGWTDKPEIFMKTKEASCKKTSQKIQSTPSL